MIKEAFAARDAEILSESQCMELLATCTVGRLAVSIGAIPAVFPVNFALLDGVIVLRTAAGTKLDAAARNSVVAFEVDSFDTLYHEGWSVLAIGVAAEIVDPVQVERAERLPLVPWADGPHEHVVAIRPELLSGRRIVHGAGTPAQA